MAEKSKRPQWTPDTESNGFASRVMDGVAGGHDGMPDHTSRSAQTGEGKTSRYRRRQLTVDDYVQGVLNNDRTILARAITLVESNSAAHMEMAQEVLRQLLPRTGNSIRIGITGVPGVGKSTFIEALGCYLCRQGHHVAVRSGHFQRRNSFCHSTQS